MKKDIDVLARTIYGEARGESRDGQIAVGWVILNRYRTGRWFAGETIAETCTKPFQFSCWNATDPNREKLLNATEAVLKPFWDLAERLINDEYKDPTGGATHYHTKQIKPKWAKFKTPTAIIGNHVFYNNID